MEDHVQEMLLILSKLISQGKIRAIGLSNESAWGTMKFLEHAKRSNPVSYTHLTLPTNREVNTSIVAKS